MILYRKMGIGGKAFTTFINKLMKKISNFLSKKSSSVTNKADDIFLRDADGKIKYHTNEDYSNMLQQSKDRIKRYMNSPEKANVVLHNQHLARRLGLDKGKPTYTEALENMPLMEARRSVLNAPTTIADPLDLERAIAKGESTHGQHIYTAGNKHSVKVPRIFTPEHTARSADHEFLHQAYGGTSNRYFTPIENMKVDRAFRSGPELNAISKKYGLDPHYLGYTGERITNSYDLASELGLQKFQKYPGYGEFKKMIDDYKGTKNYMVESYKKDTPRDYKRIWDLATGSLVAGSGVAAGVEAAE